MVVLSLQKYYYRRAPLPTTLPPCLPAGVLGAG
jgi:hypothetical protein